MLSGIVDFKSYFRPDGTLVPVEFNALPFVPKRAFWIYDVPMSAERANHAHRECHQLLFAIHGRFRARINRGAAAIRIDRRNTALYVPARTWLQLDEISRGAIILVLASHPYDVQDYIDSWEEFLKCRESA